MEIFNRLRFRKAFYSLLFILVIAGLAIGIWFWQEARKRRVLETELQRVEEQIASTEKRIKELSELSPEEILRIEKEKEILSATSATDDVIIEGVEIIKSGDKKIIKNSAQGYQIEIPKNLLVARSISSDHIEFHDKSAMCQGDPLCKPVILISVVDFNPDRLELEKWFKGEEQKSGADIYSPREKLNIDSQIVYKVIESDPPIFDNIYYYWSKEDKVYSIRVSAVEDPNYSSYIKTFKLD